MHEGFLLGCGILVFIWFIYATWKPMKTIMVSLFLTTAVWIPSIFYEGKIFNKAGYFVLPVLIFWIVFDKLKEQRGEVAYETPKGRR